MNIKSFLSSKKVKVFLLSVAALAMKDLLGLDEETVRQLITLAATYLIGQGIADHGKGKFEAAAAVAAQNGELARAVAETEDPKLKTAPDPRPKKLH